jgi:soluble lytic murein transglycosylase
MRRFAPWRGRAGLFFLALLLAYAGLVGLRAFYPIAHTAALVDFAVQNGLDPALVASVVRCESRFKASAVSSRGAIGLMQIVPETGAWIAQQLEIPDFEVDSLYDPDLNLRFGSWYLRYLLDRFGDRDDALMAYNAGPSRVGEWLAEDEDRDAFPETRAYVERVARSLPVYRLYFAAPWLYRITPSLLL